jgi:PAS domain S-box-containing protein
MDYQYVPHIWLLIVSGLISVSLGLFAFLRRRKAKGAMFFILSMLVVTLWSLPNALEMAATDLPTKMFWANMQYFAYCYSPVTLLALCMEFTGYDKWIKSKRILWLAALPTIIILLVWTDNLHGLVRNHIYLDQSGAFSVIAKDYGFAFYIHALYSHGLNLTAMILLIRAVFFKNSVYRKQAIALLFGVSLIVVPNIFYIAGYSPFEFDLTPVFFGPGGFIMLWGIFRYKMFDLVPLARATVIETMDAGVFVLDLQNRILDMNPAFRKIVNLADPKYASRRVEDICSSIPKLSAACTDRSVSQAEFSINTYPGIKTYEVLLSPLTDPKKKLIGRLAVIYEITEKKRVQQEFLKQQWKLAGIEERERMARDMHDNLGQLLGFINLQAQGILRELMNAGLENVSGKLEQLVEVTQMAHSEIRDYISNIRTSSNTEQDFVTAIKKYINIFENQSGIYVNLDISCNLTGDELKPSVWMQILYILKEALNNVRKHANAKSIGLSVWLTEMQLSAAVEDDGIGFDPAIIQNRNKSRFGLEIMKERATEIGGKLEITSVMGQGSRLVLIVPINRREAE